MYLSHMDDLPISTQSWQVACHLILRSRGFWGLTTDITGFLGKSSPETMAFLTKPMGFPGKFSQQKPIQWVNGVFSRHFMIGSYAIRIQELFRDQNPEVSCDWQPVALCKSELAMEDTPCVPVNHSLMKRIQNTLRVFSNMAMEIPNWKAKVEKPHLQMGIFHSPTPRGSNPLWPKPVNLPRKVDGTPEQDSGNWKHNMAFFVWHFLKCTPPYMKACRTLTKICWNTFPFYMSDIYSKTIS